MRHSMRTPFLSQRVLAQMRWSPPEEPTGEQTFVDGLRSMCGAGSPGTKSGIAIYLYTANKSMEDECFFNSDGDMLIGLYDAFQQFHA